MRDLLSKLDALISETALKDKEDLEAKRKALADLEADPVASKDPKISSAIDQRRGDLEKEAKAKGFTESFEIGDEFGISFSEDHEISTTIVGFLEDGIVIELDDAAIEMLTNEGLTFLEGEIVNEDKQKGVDGKACWKGYKRMGTKQKGGKTVDNCVKMGEDLDEYFQFEFPKGKDRGPRDHGTDELERREKSFRKHELAKDGRDYKDAMSPKSKSSFKGKYNIAGPKGKLPEDSVEESGLQYHTGVKKHGKEYMDKAAEAGRKGASQKELGALKDKYSKAYKESAVALPDISGLGYDAQSLILKLRRDVEEKRLQPTRQAVLSAANELAGDMDFAPELLVRQVLGKSVTEGSAHGYNVARYYEKYNDQKKITNWLRTNAGLDKTAPVYFDDADLVYGDQTIVPDALINPKYKMSDLLDAVVQAAGRDDVNEAEYQGRKVQLGKKMAGDVKKSKVYVRNPKGNVVKVNFGDKKMKIKKSNPARRKSFRARHNCANPGPRHKARYWSCRSW
jgi:hypothetical protein